MAVGTKKKLKVEPFMTNELITPQTQEKIKRAWELLYEHLQGCEVWSNGCKVDKNTFIERCKKEL
jgi:hypothetical protein